MKLRKLTYLVTLHHSNVYSLYDIEKLAYQAAVNTEPSVVTYNGTVLTHNAGALGKVGTNEWDWNSNSLYVNVGADPDNGSLAVGYEKIAYQAAVNTEPSVVTYNGTVLTHSAGALGKVGTNEWDWNSNSLYVNVGADPDNGSLAVGYEKIAYQAAVNTEPSVVTYNGTVLTHNAGALGKVGTNEWDWNSNSLYVNVGADPDNGSLAVGYEKIAYQATVNTEPSVVTYNGTILTHSAGALGKVGTNEWDWNSNSLYVNVGADPDNGSLAVGYEKMAYQAAVNTEPLVVAYNGTVLTHNAGALGKVGTNEWDWNSNSLYVNVGATQITAFLRQDNEITS